MSSRRIAVIGVGNMARSIICGIIKAKMDVDEIVLFDKNVSQYNLLNEVNDFDFKYASDIEDAVASCDTVLLSVKPQNYDEVLATLRCVNGYSDKLYISIAAGITVDSVSTSLDGARVVRVLPNVPMLIGQAFPLFAEMILLEQMILNLFVTCLIPPEVSFS